MKMGRIRTRGRRRGYVSKHRRQLARSEWTRLVEEGGLLTSPLLTTPKDPNQPMTPTDLSIHHWMHAAIAVTGIGMLAALGIYGMTAEKKA